MPFCVQTKVVPRIFSLRYYKANCCQAFKFVSLVIFQFISSLRFLIALIKKFLSTVPDNGPATITPVAVSSSVVNVSWTHVPVDIRNGIILGYYVSWGRSPYLCLICV